VNCFQLKSEPIAHGRFSLKEEDSMGQLHKRFSVEQIKVLLRGYLQGTINRAEIEEVLQVNKARLRAGFDSNTTYQSTGL
jgi:hypothetical protein